MDLELYLHLEVTAYHHDEMGLEPELEWTLNWNQKVQPKYDWELDLDPSLSPPHNLRWDRDGTGARDGVDHKLM